VNPSQIEAWTLDIVERVTAGSTNEDVRVELKGSMIEPAKAARRIAGHANAAGGVPILWIFGLDETTGVLPIERVDFASWWASVVAAFDEIAPDPTELVVPTANGPVLAVLFATDRAPFLVRNPLFGVTKGEVVAWEVPWREGTATRTARRRDLIRLLTPLQTAPEVIAFGGWLSYSHDRSGSGNWFMSLDLYIDMPVGESLVIADHRLIVDVEWPQWRLPMDAKLYGPGEPTLPIGRTRNTTVSLSHRGDGQLIVEGPGPVDVIARGFIEPAEAVELETCFATVQFVPSRSSRRTTVRTRLVPVMADTDEIARWVVSDPGGTERLQDQRVIVDDEGNWGYIQP
jgi:hypothetical protein